MPCKFRRSFKLVTFRDSEISYLPTSPKKMVKIIKSYLFILFLSTGFCQEDPTKEKQENEKIQGKAESEAPACPEHSHFEICGPSCKPSCAKIWNELPLKCGAECVAGCFCDAGYIYDETQKKCVEPKDCIVVACKDHEYFSECGNNCGKICDEGPEAGCDKLCEVGCFCVEGYKWNSSQKKCVKDIECKIPCGEFQEYKECGSKCPINCDNWADPARKCPGDACVAGCVCQAGYVLDVESKKCITPLQCPKPPICGQNSAYALTGMDCRTCANYRSTSCFQDTTPKCYCNKGYVRDYHRQCVPETTCPDLNCQQTDPNTIYTACAVCLPSCRRQKNYLCPPQCRYGCKCKEGYIKEENSGICITMAECDQLLAEEAKEPKINEDNQPIDETDSTKTEL